MPTQTDIDRLVAAAVSYAEEYDREYEQISQEGKAVIDLAKPFRPKKPRVGTLVVKTPNSVFPNATTVINDGGIELTDEVKVRLSETAGVDEGEIKDALINLEDFEYDYVISKIIPLIAKGKVDYE
jgi:hypothetical protein